MIKGTGKHPDAKATMGLIKFYKTEADFTRFHAKLKLCACPHCLHIGYLILHGYLYGFTESDSAGKIRKGRRIYCSNRDKKNGCGKTFSILMTGFIKNHIVSSQTLSRFLSNIKEGKSKARANRDSGNKMKASTVYRIFNKFTDHQVRIRTLLSRLGPPPRIKHIKDAAIETIVHLQSSFQGCPVSQFQYYFQASFF
jgi:hypothetical protein